MGALKDSGTDRRGAPNSAKKGQLWRYGESHLFWPGSCSADACTHTLEPSSEANFTQRDKKLLANAPYAKANIPTAYQRAIVQYHRKEAPGSIVVDTDARYLYYVLPDNRAIRYGVIVGEEALSWYGIAKVGRKEEWPSWTPTADIKKRLDVPNFVEGGAHNPMGARGIYLYQAARTRCSASTAPTSLNISGRRSRRAASA